MFPVVALSAISLAALVVIVVSASKPRRRDNANDTFTRAHYYYTDDDTSISSSTWDWQDLSSPAPSPGVGYTSYDERLAWDCTGVHGNGGLLSLLRQRWLARGDLHAPTLRGEIRRIDGLAGGYRAATDAATKYLSTAPSGDRPRFVVAGDRLVFMTKTEERGSNPR